MCLSHWSFIKICGNSKKWLSFFQFVLDFYSILYDLCTEYFFKKLRFLFLANIHISQVYNWISILSKGFLFSSPLFQWYLSLSWTGDFNCNLCINVYKRPLHRNNPILSTSHDITPPYVLCYEETSRSNSLE